MGATCSREDPEQEHDHDDNGRRHTNQADGGGGAGAKGALNGGHNAVGNSSGNGGGGSAAKVVLPGSRSPDVRSEWQFDKVLGRGQFGVTRLVVHRVTGERAACKSISKRK
jgi:calcium-dependent protein kinase